jgi:Xaa-Pro aminopeptidase
MANGMTHKEAVGKKFDIELMRFASAQAWRGVEIMRSMFKPGMRESEARRLAESILRDVGMERIWHPTLIRFGSNTLKKFNQVSEGDPVLSDDDIYFIDIGPVFGGHEGDVGATFVTGGDADMQACAAAAKTLFVDVSNAWREQRLTGPSLYDFAARQAQALGWKLNLDIQGHRVSDFPHAIHRGGPLGAMQACPVAGVWILEIQIAHPSKAYGAFYEDLLI